MIGVRQRGVMFVYACQDVYLALAGASVDLYHARIYLFRAFYDEEDSHTIQLQCVRMHA